MNPAAIIKDATADGVNFALSPNGTIKASGKQAAMNRWLPSIREHKPAIVVALTAELQWREFESLLAIVGPAYNTPSHEYEVIRELARNDLSAAISCYRIMAAQIVANK